MARGRRLWIRAAGQGGDLRVYITRKDIMLDGDTCRATYDPTSDEIEISADQGETSIKRSLFHELMHKAFGAMSGDLREKILGGKTPNARAEREELVVSYLEPVLYDLLSRNGWLRFPKPPTNRASRESSAKKARDD